MLLSANARSTPKEERVDKLNRIDATADYNGDGKTDLKWHESDGSNSYWLMDSGWAVTI